MNRTQPLVLGIESSCDETGVGIVRGTALLSNTVKKSTNSALVCRAVVLPRTSPLAVFKAA